MDIQPPRPVETAAPSVAEAPALDVTDTPAPVTTDPVAVTPLVAATSSPHTHKAPIGAIISAVLIAVLLAVVSVVAYMRTQDKKPAATSSNSTTATKAPETVTATDVDAASSDIDSNLSQVDDTADFNSDSLSDSALGL